MTLQPDIMPKAEDYSTAAMLNVKLYKCSRRKLSLLATVSWAREWSGLWKKLISSRVYVWPLRLALAFARLARFECITEFYIPED
jgi:hypothetical protein